MKLKKFFLLSFLALARYQVRPEFSVLSTEVRLTNFQSLQPTVNEFFTQVQELPEDYEIETLNVNIIPSNNEKGIWNSLNDNKESINFEQDLDIKDEESFYSLNDDKESINFEQDLDIKDEEDFNVNKMLKDIEEPSNELERYDEKSGQNIAKKQEFEEIKLENDEKEELGEEGERKNINPNTSTFSTIATNILFATAKVMITGVSMLVCGSALALAGGLLLAAVGFAGAITAGALLGATVGGVVGGALGWGFASVIGASATNLAVTGALIGGGAGIVQGGKKGYGWGKTLMKAIGIKKVFDFGKKIGSKFFGKKEEVSNIESHEINIKNVNDDSEVSHNRLLAQDEVLENYQDLENEVSFKTAKTHFSEDDISDEVSFKTAKTHFSEDEENDLENKDIIFDDLNVKNQRPRSQFYHEGDKESSSIGRPRSQSYHEGDKESSSIGRPRSQSYHEGDKESSSIGRPRIHSHHALDYKTHKNDVSNQKGGH